jgi:hypothetical protein
MWEEAQAGIEKCAALAPGIPELEEFRQQLETSCSAAAPAPEVEVVEEEPAPEPTVSTLVFDAAELGIEEPTPPEAPPASEPAAQPEAARAVPAPPPHPAAFEPVAETPPAPQANGDVLTNMVLDLEEMLGENFTGATPSVSASAVPAKSVPAAGVPPAAVPRPGTVTTPSVASSDAVSLPVIPAAAATMIAPTMVQAPQPGQESDSALADVFGEFKEEMEAGAAGGDEQDPETHYNLGVAFKEMGLLDEAIGELQKVCQAIDRGEAFPHVLQVYTWLAECLRNKGAPQAAIKWYQRAVQLPGMDEETRIAVYYEMAAAYEACGNRQAALDTFMEVYAHNIDYRDVAERIKTLRA